MNRPAEPIRKGEKIQPDDISGSNPYLDALEYLARHHDKPFSRNEVLQTLPLQEEALDSADFRRAAERIGLTANILRRRPSSVPGMVCPYVVPLSSGDVAIVTEKRRRGVATVVIPSAPQPIRLKPRELDGQSTGVVIFVADADSEAGPSEAPRRWRGHWLWSEVGAAWGTWLYVMVAAFFINLLGLALPLFVMNVYDRVIPNNSIPTLWALTAGVAIAIGFDFLLRIMRAVVIDGSAQRIDMRVSSKLFEQALDARMDNRTGQTGELSNQIREFESVRDFFSSAGIASIIDLLFIGIFLGVLWLIVGPLVLVALVAVPVVLIATLLIQIPLGISVRNAQRNTASRQGVLVDLKNSIETVKANAAEGYMQGKWERSLAGSVRSTGRSRFWSSLAMFFTLSVQQVVTVTTIVWGVYLVSAGTITIGALIASNILAGRVLAPLSSIALTLARTQQSFAALRALNRLMRMERDHGQLAKPHGPVREGKIEIRDVSFSYSERLPAAIDQLSLSIRPGEKVGVIGRVGCGKSTLGKLLCGLYSPDKGSILIDDTDIRQYSVSDIRAGIVYSGQDGELFSGTLRENLLMARHRPDEELEECAAITGVSELARLHPHGYGMLVGERGRALSGGQRQAVALTRAMLARPKLLFLDEPTSAMDTQSELALINNLREWLPDNMTLMLSTHRTSILELVTRLIVLDKGRVVADGPKDKVMAALDKKGRIRTTASVSKRNA